MNADATFTWWGCATVEIEIDGRRLLVDPYINPPHATAHYVFVTHDDYDHCHEPTLRRLAQAATFTRIVLPRACLVKSLLDSPTHGESHDLDYIDDDRVSVLYPKHTREPGFRHPGPTELELDGLHVETVDTSERPQRYRPQRDALWPSGTGPYVGDAAYPNLGYVITARRSGITFYHPGDLGDVFDGLRGLRGKIDVMFFPIVKLTGQELTMIDAVRPRYIVPIHYRLREPGFSLPMLDVEPGPSIANLVTAGPKPGTAPEDWRRDTHELMEAHWHPTTDPPLERIVAIAPELEKLGTKLVVATGGEPFAVGDLPAPATRTEP